MPEDVKEQIERVLQPKEEITEKGETQKLKTAVGHLRDLTNRKLQIQSKVDNLKEQYRVALQELQDIQSEIDTTQKDLKTATEQYAKLVEVKDEHGPTETQVGVDTMLELLQKVGMNYTDAQKEDLQKLLEENHHKRRRVGLPGEGHCG